MRAAVARTVARISAMASSRVSSCAAGCGDVAGGDAGGVGLVSAGVAGDPRSAPSGRPTRRSRPSKPSFPASTLRRAPSSDFKVASRPRAVVPQCIDIHIVGGRPHDKDRRRSRAEAPNANGRRIEARPFGLDMNAEKEGFDDSRSCPEPCCKSLSLLAPPPEATARTGRRQRRLQDLTECSQSCGRGRAAGLRRQHRIIRSTDQRGRGRK